MVLFASKETMRKSTAQRSPTRMTRSTSAHSRCGARQIKTTSSPVRTRGPDECRTRMQPAFSTPGYPGGWARIPGAISSRCAPRGRGPKVQGVRPGHHKQHLRSLGLLPPAISMPSCPSLVRTTNIFGLVKLLHQKMLSMNKSTRAVKVTPLFFNDMLPCRVWWQTPMVSRMASCSAAPSCQTRSKSTLIMILWHFAKALCLGTPSPASRMIWLTRT